MMIKYALKYIKHIKINQNFFRTIGKKQTNNLFTKFLLNMDWSIINFFILFILK